MIVIDNREKIHIELTEMELVLLEDSLKQTTFGVAEFYGKTFHRLISKLQRARLNGRRERNKKRREKGKS